jgi:tetratricopeptide (TPR) repeat protein
MSEEVMMSRNRTASLFIGTLALVMIFAFVSCQKLSVSKLSANYSFSKANQLFRDAKYSKAIVEYENAVRRNPDLKDAYRFLGESYKNLYIPGKDSQENKEKAAKALAALKKAYEIDPNNKDVIYSLGDMYDRLRNFDEAEKMYLRIVDLEPGNMNNYYVVAEFYKRYAGEKKELKAKAEDMYLRRIETDPENVQGYAYMADYFDKLPPTEYKEKFDNALEFVKKRQMLEPNSAVIYYTIGVNRFSKVFQLQNFLSQQEKEVLGAEAEKNLLKAIDLDPNFAEPYSYMKILYINVQAKIYPEKESRYMELATQYGQKWDDARKRQLERMKLEKELKRTG